MNLKSKIESILFVSIKPMSTQKLSALLKTDHESVKKAVEELKAELNAKDSGLRIMQIGQKVEMATSPDNSSVVKDYLRDEQSGDLTRPALETLTIIAYRGPITKADLDTIRGVNCALIIRNLLIKGLIESYEDKKNMATYYQITFDFLRFLGLNEAKELPDYEKLNASQDLEKLLIMEKDSASRAL